MIVQHRARGRRLAAMLLALLAAVGTIMIPAGPAGADPATVARYQKWYFDLLKITQVHQVTKGAGQVVGLVDDNVDNTLPDLRDRLVPGRGIGNFTSPEGYGERGRHGTEMAGIIAGRGDGTVLGIAPEARVMPISVGVGGVPQDIAVAIRWAADHDVKIVNLSLGSDAPPSAAEQSAVEYAISKDVVVVASMGNTREFSSVSSLARIPGVVAVTGITKGAARWTGSTTGPQAVIAAPATDVIGPCSPVHCPDGMIVSSGTSPAAAIVSGVVALIRAKHPGLDAAGVVNRLTATATDKGPKGRDDEYGFGVVDPLAALTADVPAAAADPLRPSTPAGGAPAPPPGAKKGFLAGAGGIVALSGVVIVVAVLVLILVMRRRRATARPAPPCQQPVPAQQPPVPPWRQAPPGPAAPQWQPSPGQDPPPWQQPPGAGQRPPRG